MNRPNYTQNATQNNAYNPTQLMQWLSSIGAGLLISSAGAVQATPVVPTAAPTGATPTVPATVPGTVPGTVPSAPAAPTVPTQPGTPAPMKPDAMPADPAKALGKEAPEEPTIAEVAASNPSFKTLNAALKAAGLTEVLDSKGPFTVFAPTDKAFAALPKGTVETLLKPENKEKLVQLLTYHVVSGEVESNMLKSGPVKSIEGRSIAVKVKGKAVMVNDSNVTTADVVTGNGIIHVIDKVMVPPVATTEKPSDKTEKPATKTTTKPATKSPAKSNQPAHLH